MSCRIVFTRRAERDVDDIPDGARGRLAKRIDGLASEPRPPGSRKLAGSEDLYRLRSGDYRIIYSIEDRLITVTIIRIGHRRDIYR